VSQGTVKTPASDGLAVVAEQARDRDPGIGLRRRTHRVLELAEPGDDLSRFVDVLLIGLILLNVAAVLSESVEFIRARFSASFLTFELLSVVVFTVEYLCRVWTSVEQPRFQDGRSPWLIRARFMISPMALVDLLAVLPFYLATLGVFGGFDMRFLRSLRLVRLFKLTRYSQAMTLLLDVLRENGRNFAAALGVLMIVMVLAASGIYLFERDAQPDEFGSIPAAMWWAFATLTTVGYGDVTPITNAGKVFGAMMTVVSIGIVALPAGILASSFSERLRMASQHYRDRVDEAWADGVVTDQEAEDLEQTRVGLGLGEDMAATILAEERRRGRELAAGRCPNCGEHL
jgi:voltage-gated potassium channel